MADSTPTDIPAPSATAVAKATSELNNLLHIMAGTSASIQQATKDSGNAAKYVDLLHTSIARAEKVTADLTAQAGGSNQKSLLHPELAAFTRRKKPSGPLSAKRTILIVDDEQEELNLIERILVDAGFAVVTAQSAFECLELFRMRPHQFALVLLDLTLPFMDGEETFHRLRDIQQGIPVVLCTGFVQQDRLSNMMNCGLAGFLRKPIPPDEIVALVRQILESAKYSRKALIIDEFPEAV